jgi:anaerobic magnesium-protoporphyrin IX monomethyl ester cyclase
MWVKSIEVIMQLRPKAVIRNLFGKDNRVCHAMRWYTKMGRRVWLHEIAEFVFKVRFSETILTLKDFWGESLHEKEEALSKKRKTVIPINQLNLSLDTDSQANRSAQR